MRASALLRLGLRCPAAFPATPPRGHGGVRLLSSRMGRGRGRERDPKAEQAEKEWEKYEQEVIRRLNATGVPKFRLPPPTVPKTHLETWVVPSHVADDPEENVISFCTRFYLDSTMGSTGGLQPVYQTKVQMVVKLKKLGLSAREVNRIVAVSPANNYDEGTGELKLQSNKFSSVQKNKMECRRLLDALIDDARENADAHANTPDSQLPLHARSPGWRWLASTPRTGS